jgi:hypothetical protein
MVQCHGHLTAILYLSSTRPLDHIELQLEFEVEEISGSLSVFVRRKPARNGFSMIINVLRAFCTYHSSMSSYQVRFVQLHLSYFLADRPLALIVSHGRPYLADKELICTTARPTHHHRRDIRSNTSKHKVRLTFRLSGNVKKKTSCYHSL